MELLQRQHHHTGIAFMDISHAGNQLHILKYQSKTTLLSYYCDHTGISENIIISKLFNVGISSILSAEFIIMRGYTLINCYFLLAYLFSISALNKLHSFTGYKDGMDIVIHFSHPRCIIIKREHCYSRANFVEAQSKFLNV